MIAVRPYTILPHHTRRQTKEEQVSSPISVQDPVRQLTFVFQLPQARLIAGAELAASLLQAEPAPYRQTVPPWLCGGSVKGAVNSSTWEMLV